MNELDEDKRRAAPAQASEWQGVALVHSFIAQPFYSPALEINLLWPYLLIPIGYALMCLRMIQGYACWRAGGIAPFAARVEE